MCISDMERPSAHNHQENFSDWDQRSQTCVSITKPSPVKQVYCPPDWCLSPLQWTLSIHVPHMDKHKIQFSLPLCFHYCYFVANPRFTALRILEHADLLIDPGPSSTTDCSVSAQHRQKRSQVWGCQHWNVRAHVSINVKLWKKTFRLIVTCSCAY